MNAEMSRLQPFTDWLPFVYVLSLAGVEFWADMQRRGPGYSHTSFIAFLPMAFFFTGLIFMRYRKRIETLERRVAEMESSASTRG